MGFLHIPFKNGRFRAREKYQEREEILYYGTMNKPLNLSLDRTAKIPLAEQISRGVTAAIEGGVLELCAQRRNSARIL